MSASPMRSQPPRKQEPHLFFLSLCTEHLTPHLSSCWRLVFVKMNASMCSEYWVLLSCKERRKLSTWLILEALIELTDVKWGIRVEWFFPLIILFSFMHIRMQGNTYFQFLPYSKMLHWDTLIDCLLSIWILVKQREHLKHFVPSLF